MGAEDSLFEVAFNLTASYETVVCIKEVLTLLSNRARCRERYMKAMTAASGYRDEEIVVHKMQILDRLANTIPDSDVEKTVDFLLKV